MTKHKPPIQSLMHDTNNNIWQMVAETNLSDDDAAELSRHLDRLDVPRKIGEFRLNEGMSSSCNLQYIKEYYDAIMVVNVLLESSADNYECLMNSLDKVKSLYEDMDGIQYDLDKDQRKERSEWDEGEEHIDYFASINYGIYDKKSKFHHEIFPGNDVGAMMKKDNKFSKLYKAIEYIKQLNPQVVVSRYNEKKFGMSVPKFRD